MRIFGLIGWSGSGKTTLMVALVPEMVRRGFSVSTIKHSHHGFDVDTPGKDSYRHREAGATEVMVTAASRWVLMHELRGDEEPDLDAQAARMSPVELLLVEGFKHHSHAKMEIFREAVGRPPLSAEDASAVALATDAPKSALAGVPAALRTLDLNDVPAIADFIQKFTGLGGTGRGNDPA